MNDADVPSDDDHIVDKRNPTQAELQNVQSELLRAADKQSSLDVHMLHQLQHTDFSNISSEK